MKVLVTGGAGYIGSHTCVELLKAGHELVVVDNFSNSRVDSLEQVEKIAGRSVRIYDVDLLEKEKLAQVFGEHSIEAVIHLAGFKAVGESVEFPLKYYRNNLIGTLNLCEVMSEHEVYQLVFSSSACVYGIPKQTPVPETANLQAINPYGNTKRMLEDMLEDLSSSNENWRVAVLRYFNPVGAHPSGLIGEEPKGTPNNLMPYITQVAIGQLPRLSIFGDDYDTEDGTCVRDYIHVVDLAQGHVSALEHLSTGVHTYNLGTGRGYSVYEVVKAFEEANALSIPVQVVERRPGDAAVSYADPAKAERELGWRAEKGIFDMCQDAWRWQKHRQGGNG
ncbi:UDP-glucose 4-epimerase GalE [Shouchella shacheensis]|uniref:UDP-glucose 4-epimerase GalE n=1 Tax=Shouchella shacheensis TaxID=1649580 RepID=UPI00073FD586|nr:UDP-glucose 4-epimerase GalE [Shouchella shacheensis]